MCAAVTVEGVRGRGEVEWHVDNLKFRAHVSHDEFHALASGVEVTVGDRIRLAVGYVGIVDR